MTLLQMHPYTASLLVFLLGLICVRISGLLCSKMSRSNVYVLCLYYVSTFFSSLLFILLGYDNGYIGREDGKFVGIFGALIEKILYFMTDIRLQIKILVIDVAFTGAFATSVFILAGLTYSLPRVVKEIELFSRVFERRAMNNSADTTIHNVEEYLSQAGKRVFWLCALFLVKSLASIAAILLAVGTFSVFEKWDIYTNPIYYFWFLGVSMVTFSYAVMFLYLSMCLLFAITGEYIFADYSLWTRLGAPSSKLFRRFTLAVRSCLLPHIKE